MVKMSTVPRYAAVLVIMPDFEIAVIDLDQVYMFVRQHDGYGEPTTWARARRGAAALVKSLVDTGMSIVIVEGEFFNAEELGALTGPIHGHIVRYFFTLSLSYEHAFKRVQADPSRGASKDAAFLKSLHGDFARALPFLTTASVVLDTDHRTRDEVITRLIAVVREHNQRFPQSENR